MGVIVECDGQEVWSPSGRVGRLFAEQIKALERVVGQPSGVDSTVADTLEVDAPIFNATFPFHADVGGSIAQDFMAKNPTVRIDAQPLSGNAVEKITAAVAGGDAPDMRIMYVSVDRYRGAGLDVTKPPKTWAEFEDVIQKTLRGGRGNQDIEALGFGPFLGSGGIYRWLVPYWQLGGELLSPDKEKATINNDRAFPALSWVKKVVDAQGGYQKMLDFEKGTTYQQLFMDNKAAHMYATYAERAQEFKIKAPTFEFSFFPYPLPPNGCRANYGGGLAHPE